MDQIRIGKFIAETRKSRSLTQGQLANTLSISDKTVSKWECGKGLPEVSLMLPLCEALGITVNDLLSGERVSPKEYQKKAEENMMDLVKENSENRKRMALSVISGVNAVIACCALIALAAYVALPMAVRILLIVLSILVMASGITAAIMLDIKAGYFECSHCKALFVPGMSEYVAGVHTFTRRRLTCPQCGKTGMCAHRISR